MSNKMDRPLVTVDGRTLMDRPLEPPNFVVDTLISQGLHILAGSPKVGKSWLALWLAVTVAKGEPVWGMSVKQGTTLYLCLEDSVLRIQNRLFEITEDAPDSVHFCTECAPIGQGLEEQVEGFLVAHPDTVLVLVDTLQMVRPVHDATYANDYRDLSVLKRLADKHGIAILLIHHLRKETADDVFNRISGTTAISGAVDSSFTLVEDRRGSGKAKLSCIGRDIEYRELSLERNVENVWEMVADSRTQPELLGDRITYLVSELMRDRTKFIGTPTELSEKIDPVGMERISPKKVSRLILQNLDALSKIGISGMVRRSNAARGLDEIPTIHEGVTARALERKGVIADRCEINRQIKADNALLRELKAEIKKLATLVARTVPAIAEGLEKLRSRVLIFCYQLSHIRGGKSHIQESLAVWRPELERYPGLVQQIKEKSKERKALVAEKKELPIYHVKRHKALAVRITELTEDLEELRSGKALLLQKFEYAEDAGAEAFRKDIAIMEAGLKKLEAQEQKYSAELDKALDEYAELKAQAADFDPVELYKARQVIRPALEKAVKKQLEDTMQEKPSLIVLLSAKQEASRLLGEDTEERQVRQLIMRRQKEQRTVPQNQSKKKEHWER